MKSVHLEKQPFPPTGESDWRRQIIADVAPDDPAEILTWLAEDGVALDAVSTRESGHRFPDPPYDRHWRIADSIPSEATIVSPMIDLRALSYLGRGHGDQCALAAAAAVKALRSHSHGFEKLLVVVPVGTTIVLEIGKLRALRVLLNETLRVARGDENSMDARSAADSKPDVTIFAVAGHDCESADLHRHQIRLTYSCLGALLGSSDEIYATPYDASERSRVLALNVLRVLRHEARLAQVATAANGSYYLDQVACTMYEVARNRLLRIDNAGGLSAVMAAGGMDALDMTFKESDSRDV